MSLRARLKKQAEADLDIMVEECRRVSDETVADTGVDATELLKLAVGGRTDTIKTKALKALADAHEDQLEELLDSQEKLDLGDLSGSGKVKK